MHFSGGGTQVKLSWPKQGALPRWSHHPSDLWHLPKAHDQARAKIDKDDIQLGVVACAWNSSAWETEAGCSEFKARLHRQDFVSKRRGGGGDGGRKRRRKGGRERLGLYQGSVSLLLLPVRLFRRHCLLFPWLPQSSRLSFQLQNEDNEDEDATKAKHKFPTLF